MADDERSIAWIVVSVAILVAVFGWGFLAGSYAGAHAKPMSEMSDAELEALDLRGVSTASRAAPVVFLENAIEQLPNFVTVVSWHFANRIWLPILIGLAMAGVVGGGFALK
jgi:uncharacterized membrane protein